MRKARLSRHLQIIDMRTLDVVADLDQHRSVVRCLDSSPNRALLASAAEDSSAIVWQLDQVGFPVVQRINHPDSVWAVSFNSKGALLATTSRDGTIQVHLTDTWEKSQHIKAESGCGRGAVFHPRDPEILLVGLANGHIQRVDGRAVADTARARRLDPERGLCARRDVDDDLGA
eukprot:TRINITY_DN2195_c0_g1_i1.p2 TRINITY_DN2195_c0_g1~~TRINITY_DN2195_c0_g1_i1.p2  ORF type:complete len:174 (+),score=23.80 TRINITY_DN2195_c0_g1_i1:224-745(+)